ncbi:hypothetical protein PUN28_015841 [Cardiocondyla obscurior]|uniref:Histone H3 n=1 Tax=Cardiocondyla obscurior TaxID=286306 RepID=A0AAW2ETP1_9HYME
MREPSEKRGSGGGFDREGRRQREREREGKRWRRSCLRRGPTRRKAKRLGDCGTEETENRARRKGEAPLGLSFSLSPALSFSLSFFRSFPRRQHAFTKAAYFYLSG